MKYCIQAVPPFEVPDWSKHLFLPYQKNPFVCMQSLHKNPFLPRSEQWWTVIEMIQIDKMFSSWI